VRREGSQGFTYINLYKRERGGLHITSLLRRQIVQILRQQAIEFRENVAIDVEVEGLMQGAADATADDRLVQTSEQPRAEIPAQATDFSAQATERGAAQATEGVA
jgi:hypothetical protein